MRPFTTTIPFQEALRLVVDAAVPIDATERVAIGDADDRVASRDVIADADVPPFDRAAMDGYAVVAADTAGATREAARSLVCVDRVFTGQTSARTLARGECIEIATGAPLPAGADAVVMVEDTERPDASSSLGDSIRVLAAVAPGQHVGRRGADLAAGQTAITAQQVLTPSRIGALAAAGLTHVEVYRRPTVAILSTGNELVEPGRPLGPGQIYEINRFTLAAVIRRHGGVPVMLPTAGDTMDDLSRAVEAARGHDVIIFSGGSSVGERDLVLDALREHGEVIFHGIAVKPGKPTAFGRIGPTPVLGMPGNPTSCLSNAYMLLVPFVRKMARLPAWQPRTIDAPLARRIASAAGRHQFYTVRVVNGVVEPAFKGSGDITSMANADGYIEIGAEVTDVPAGTSVTVKLF